MRQQPIHHCTCEECQKPESNPTKDHHTQLNLFLGTLTEQQRRLLTGLEANRLGSTAEEQLALVTGLSVADVTLGQRELIQAQATGQIPESASDKYQKKCTRACEGLRARFKKVSPTLPDHQSGMD